MDKGKLASIGGFLAVAGLLSIVLSFVGYNLTILMWIDSWGEAMGWIIRIAVTGIGAALFVVGKMGAKPAAG